MRDFPSIAAICEPDHVLALPSKFASTKETFSVALLFFCAVFGMAQFEKREPDMPGAQQRA
jgi:hypothetical protein